MEDLHKKNVFKIGAVISEFNPFHNGHKYCINAFKEKGATHIVCIMSGCFVQRGEAAVVSPYERAKAAVANGADLVLELPAVWSLASAERFSDGAVYIADKLNCVDYLGFGVEWGDDFDDFVEKIKKIESKRFEKLKKLMENGLSYPMALEKVCIEEYSDDFKTFLQSGNNVLAMSYIKSLEKINSKIKPVYIKRKSSLHDSMQTPVDDIASASYIRNLMFNQDLKYTDNFLPEQMRKILYDDLKFGKICKMKNLERAILYKLRTSQLSDFENILDIGKQGLANRCYKSRNASSVDEFLEQVKTKRYPMARIKRHLLGLTLGIDNSFKDTMPCYARILAMNKRGTEILREIKYKSDIITSTSLSEIENTGENAKRIARVDAAAYDLYSLGFDVPCSGAIAYTQKITISCS